jgi:signal transduction histidine kinase
MRRRTSYGEQVLGRPRPVELLLTATVLVLSVAELWVPFTSLMGSGSRSVDTLPAVVSSLSLLWCRRWPAVPAVLTPLVWAPAFVAGDAYVTFWSTFVVLLISLFMAGRFAGPRQRLLAIGFAALSLVGVELSQPLMRDGGEIAFDWVLALLVLGAGTGLRVFETRAQEQARRAVEAEVSASLLAAEAVLEERTRIARELHDVVAHSMSSIVVQAGAAEGADDDSRRGALAAIRTTGTEALAEMRRLVTMLRSDEDGPSRAPQPRLEGLSELVGSAGHAGLTAVLRLTGERRPLPAGLDLTIYRIVQEALTNVRRHACATACEVTVDYRADEVRVEIRDDGTGGTAGTHGRGTSIGATPSGGHGLIGMRERAGLYGGQIEADAHPDGGFLVRARLPLAVPE